MHFGEAAAALLDISRGRVMTRGPMPGGRQNIFVIRAGYFYRPAILRSPHVRYALRLYLPSFRFDARRII